MNELYLRSYRDSRSQRKVLFCPSDSMNSNIDPIYFLTFLVPIIVNSGLLIYFRKKRTVRLSVLGYAFLAYFVAIAIKLVFQHFTAAQVVSTYGYSSVETGLYYGLQTSILEVGLAYLFAGYAFRKKDISTSNAVSYGVSLSFWENAIYLGVLSGISLIADYLIIAVGPSSISHLVYGTVASNDPSLLYGPVPALVNTSLSILERTSSLLAHTAWGILTVLAVAYRKRVYFYAAFPMGMIDSLVPYASYMGVYAFEGTILALSVLFFTGAYLALIKTRRISHEVDLAI